MDGVVALGAAKADAKKKFATRHQSAIRGTARVLPALPPVMATPPARSLNPAIGTFTSYTLADSLLKVTPKGGLFITYTANGYDSLRNTVSPVTSSAYPTPSYIDFLTDDSFDVKFRDNSGSSLATLWAWVDELDGAGWQRVTTLTESAGASALNGGAQVFRYTFASSKMRRVRVFFKNCDFAGVRHAPTTIMQPAPHTELKVAILGDSWTDNASGVLGQHSMAYTACLLLGFEPLLCGQAGTGYVTPTNNANLGNYIDTRRTDPIAAAAPDYIWVFASINDDLNYGPTPANPTAPAGPAPTATVTANATTLYARFAQALPKTKIIAFGPQSIGSPTGGFGDTNTNRLANRTAVKAAADTAANVLKFIDPIAEKWVTGTGNSTAATGVGTSDKLMNSTYHLSQFGHDILAQRIGQSVADTLNNAQA
jgi:hypothetical protein